jgi:D-alanyl-D-alanine dipeptidase
MSCSPSSERTNFASKNNPVILFQKKENVNTSDTSTLEHLLIEKKLVNISSLDSNIRVALHYSTSQNFLNKPLYEGLTSCYLPCEVAIKLCNAQFYLKSQFPNYNLIIFDAVRPLHIQKQMWDELEIPAKQKIKYLANPNELSLHNYGAAVDIGIIGNNNVLLNMGTPFDFFGDLSEPKKEKQLLAQGTLSKEALNNRLILRNAMKKAGFTIIGTEWWHFNSTNKITAVSKYELIK